MVAFIAALFILFVIAHPAGPRAGHSSTADTGAGTGTGSTNNNAASSPVASNEGHNGVAGDGNHNNNNAKNVPPNTPVSSNDETNNQKEHEHSDTDKDTHTHTGSDAISETKPKLAYLLTYPMSGMTYTMILVGKTTNTTLATNYAINGFSNTDNHPVSVYSSSTNDSDGVGDGDGDNSAAVAGSPFWGFTYSKTRNPTDYVLTLTHCAGSCMHPCTPDKYIQTESSFEEACRTVIDFDKNDEFEISLTPKAHVAKLVHLLREPYSNIVSRFHAYQVEAERHKDTLKLHPNDQEGFHDYCRDIDSDAIVQELEYESLLISTEIKELMQNVPCHSEFFKYVAWHSHVVEMSWNKDYPTLTVYYEDYRSKENEQQQAIKLAEFLNLPITNITDVPGFLSMSVKMYTEWYPGRTIRRRRGGILKSLLGL